MRNVSGWLAAAALAMVMGGSALAQQVREREPARPGAAGQREAGQRDDATRPGQRDDATRPGQRDDATRPGAAGREGAALRGQGSSADQQIAALKLAMCKNEVELAKLAQQKASSPDVKQFAQKMVQDHTKACEKLEQIAGPLAADHGHGDATRPGARRPGARPDADEAPARPRGEGEEPRAGAQPDRDINVQVQPGQPGRPGADVTVRGGALGTSSGGLNWVSIHKEIADKCLESAKKELGEKEGQEFDQCYIYMAIASHQKALDSDEVFAKHATGELKNSITEGKQMTQQHLQLAKSIEQKLEGAAPRTARRPGNETTPARPEGAKRE